MYRVAEFLNAASGGTITVMLANPNEPADFAVQRCKLRQDQMSQMWLSEVRIEGNAS